MELQTSSFSVAMPSPVAVPEGALSQATEFYLKQLCGINGISYDGLDKSKYFSVTDKKEINKIFFSNMVAPPKVELAASQRKALQDMFARRVDPSNRLKDAMLQRMTYWRDAERNTQVRLAEYIGAKKAYEAALAQGDSLSLLPPVEKMLSEGRVTLHAVSAAEGYVQFATVNDCIVRHKNESAKIDFSVNLGRFIIEVDVARTKVRVKPLSGNINVDGYIHPHVSSDGAVCWGNAKDAISAALEQSDVPRIVNTLLILLSEYNDESPYVALVRFKQLTEWEHKGDIHIFKKFLLDKGLAHQFYNTDHYSVDVDGASRTVYIGCLYKHKVSGVHGFMLQGGEIMPIPEGMQWQDEYYENEPEGIDL